MILKIYGSPITPFFHNWAFNKHRGEQIAKYWAAIPDDVDILVTHGPPAGVLDANLQGEQLGCQDLMAKIMEIRPKIHIFGHVHESAGYDEKAGTHYINASVVNKVLQLSHKPMVFEIDENKNVNLIMETETKIKPEITFDDFTK
jgi:Icc-related predicted phosphoesterase